MPLTGRDLYELCAALKVPPRLLVWPRLADPDSATAFRLSDRGPAWELRLARTAGDQGGCLFLQRFPGGYRRCGILAWRPAACRVYPLTANSPGREDGPLRRRPDAVCPGDAFGPSAPSLPWEDRLAELRRRTAWDEAALAWWHTRLAQLPPGDEPTLDHYLAFLLRLHRELAIQGDGPPDSGRVARLLAARDPWNQMNSVG